MFFFYFTAGHYEECAGIILQKCRYLSFITQHVWSYVFYTQYKKYK